MKRIVLVLLLAALALPAAAEGGDVFLSHPQKALEQAAQEGKFLMFVFHTNWCASCHLMEKTTWKDEGVLSMLEGFLPVSVDGERQANLSLRYGVEAYPTILFANSDGEPMLVLLGYRSAGAMEKHIRAVWSDRERLAELASAVVGRKGDPAAVIELAEFALGQEAWGQAEELLRRALRKEKKLSGELVARARLGLGVVLTATDRCREAKKVLASMPVPPPESVVARHGSVESILGPCDG